MIGGFNVFLFKCLFNKHINNATIAAACGGTTSILDFAIQNRGESLQQGWDNWAAKAEGKAVIDYGFHMIMSQYNKEIGKEMRTLCDGGITSFKLFMAYPDVFMLNDGDIFRIMQHAASLDAMVSMHAENGSVIDVLIEQALKKKNIEPTYHALTRPSSLEAEATSRALVLAELAGTTIYIVHLTAKGALDAVTRSRQHGHLAFAETCPQYLLLSQDRYDEPNFDGAKYVMSPPLRPKSMQPWLWQGLANDTIHVVATDHCPFSLEDKALGNTNFSKIPNGAPGIETRVSLLHHAGVINHKISLHKWIDLIATTPAKIFGMFPQKGTIAPGSDADIVIFDPKKTYTISAKTQKMNVDYNPYEGTTVQGTCDIVLSRGNVIVENNQFVGQVGQGNFIKRSTCNKKDFTMPTQV